jgi:hypothetical protein
MKPVIVSKASRSKAMSKAIVVASIFEAPLLALVFYFMPVEVTTGMTSQTYYSFNAIKTHPEGHINTLLLGAEIVTIALIPLSAIVITMFRYRVR